MDIVGNKAVVAQFDELGNSGGDLALLDTLCTPDMVNHALAADRPQGLEGTREFLRNGINLWVRFKGQWGQHKGSTSFNLDWNNSAKGQEWEYGHLFGPAERDLQTKFVGD